MANPIGALFGLAALVGLAALAMKKKKEEPAAAPPPLAAGSYQIPVPTMPAMPAMPATPTAPAPVVAPSLPADLPSAIAAAFAAGDTTRARQLAAQMRAAGMVSQAESIEQVAAGIEAGRTIKDSAMKAAGLQTAAYTPSSGATAMPADFALPSAPEPAQSAPTIYPVPTPTQIIQAVPALASVPGLVAPPQPPVAVASVPAMSPLQVKWAQADPARRARAEALNMHLAGSRKGKEDKTMVRLYQQQEGLTADGLYGYATAQTLAERYGIIPTVKPTWYPPKQDAQAKKIAYLTALADCAAQDTGRIDQWKEAVRF